jgi:hypothetical protein
MIFLFGDSHINFAFKNTDLTVIDKHVSSITMYRIGRDNIILNYDSLIDNINNIICISYGEIDCRCHIHKQILLGNNEDDIITNLVENYFKTINNTIKKYKKIIIFAVIPPTKRDEYEKINGPITHEYPFVGTDNERLRYTNKINNLIEEYCAKFNFLYFNPYEYYKTSDGFLNFELSDKTVHIGNNHKLIELFKKLL